MIAFLVGLWIGANFGLLIACIVMSWGESDERAQRLVESCEASRRRDGLRVIRGQGVPR